MSDIDSLKSVAKSVNQWSNCNSAWLDTSEDESAAVVGHIDEDGNCYQVATIDCDQYYAGQDSLPLAKFYAKANPATIIALIERIESAEKQRDELLAACEKTISENGHLADGDVCTLIDFKRAIARVKGQQ